MKASIHALTAAALWALLALPALQAQVQNEEAGPPRIAVPADRPPAPVAPAVITRDDQGNATVRAIRLSEPMRVDGRLDEAVYRDVPALTGFMQTLPNEGAAATEQTEAWITYDDANVYVSARIWDSAPESEWVANEMRRDTQQLRNNDTFGVSFDTFFDHRNAFFFYTNPLGARADFTHTNEGNANPDYNPIWDVRTGRFDGGWTVEMQIPFRSIRYRPGRSQIWGVQLRRVIRRKNEWDHLTQIPRSAAPGNNGAAAIMRVSRHATLIGLEAPDLGRNLEVKPYAISGLQTDRASVPAKSNEGNADAGLDVKYGVTKSLTADLTVNPDFAQVEADEQQVNLTRFELTFPEKREFFLEGQAIYRFALGAGGGGGNVPQLFFSRRIGLQSGVLVPIVGGGRLTGKVGAFDVGALDIRTKADDAVGAEGTDFSVLRVRRDVFRRSSVGALFTNRSVSTVGTGSNQTYGADGSFSFFRDVYLNGYWARSRTPGLTDDDQSYLGSFSYTGDLLGVGLQHLRVGDNFNPEVGFVRRKGFRETTGSARFSPRPRSIHGLRRINLQASVDDLEHVGVETFLESRESQAGLGFELESSDLIELTYTRDFERLDQDFRVPGGGTVSVPQGEYIFQDVELDVGLGLQRRASGTLALQRGSFYDGDKTTVALRTGRLNVSNRLSLEPTLSFNWIDLPGGSFRSDLAVTRLNYAFTPWMFLGALVQYNSGSHSVSTNFRLRWEYRPGSELFLVYTEARATDVLDRFAPLSNRGLSLKINYLLRR